MKSQLSDPEKVRLSTTTVDQHDDNHNEPLTADVTSAGHSIRFLVWKNVAFVCAAVFFKSCGYNAISNVQSSINSEDGLGVVTLAIVTGGGVVGGFVAGPILTRVDPKWVYLGGSLPMALYVGANFYPVWAIFVPAGVLYGLGRGVANVAIKVFLARLARVYYRKYDEDADRITTRVFICDIIAVKLSVVIGNLCSSLFLDQKHDDQDGGQSLVAPSTASTVQCGADYCNEDINTGPGSTQPSRDQINALTGFGVAAVLLGCLTVLVLVDPLRRAVTVAALPVTDRESEASTHGGGAARGSLMATIRMMCDHRLLLLLPLFFFFQAGDSFWTADFTKAFISCSSGVETIGLVSMWIGVSGAVASISFGLFNTKRARAFSLTFAAFLQLGILVTLLVWTPSIGDDSNLLILSVLTVVWYLGSGIRSSLLPALLAVLFPNEMESAFTHLHVWSGLASTLMFALSDVICVYLKIYFLLVLLVLGMTGHLVVELSLRRQAAKRSNYTVIEDLNCK